MNCRETAVSQGFLVKETLKYHKLDEHVCKEIRAVGKFCFFYGKIFGCERKCVVRKNCDCHRRFWRIQESFVQNEVIECGSHYHEGLKIYG